MEAEDRSETLVLYQTIFLWRLDPIAGHGHPLLGFTIALRHTHSVGLLWRSDQPIAETST